MHRNLINRAAALVSVAICALDASGTIALAEQRGATFGRAEASFFYGLTQKGKQIALQEAFVLDLISDHVCTADDIAARMYGQIGYSTTGIWGAMMRHIPGSSATDLKDNANLFTSEATAALKETLILSDGLETQTPHWQDQIEDEFAQSNFRFGNPSTPEEYRAKLHSMLQNLHAAFAQASAQFKAKWGIDYTEVNH